MEMDNTVKEYVDKLGDLSHSIFSLLREISREQMDSAEELTNVRSQLENLYASISMISEALDSFASTIRKNEELLSFGLSLTDEVTKKVDFFLESSDTLSQKLSMLMGRREEISTIVSNLQELNQTSANTARNAEIKAYRAGSSGKGFEVVAEEFGELTGESREIVSEMVKSLESLRDQSNETVDRFSTIKESLSNFEKIANKFVHSSDEIEDKFSQILGTSDRLLNLLERVNAKKRNIETLANSLLSLSRDFLVKSGKVNLILAQKESIGEVIEHHAQLHQYIGRKKLPVLQNNISQLDAALKVTNQLNQNSRFDVANLNLSQIYKDWDLKELQTIQEILGKVGSEMEGIGGVIKITLEKAKEGIENINKIKFFIKEEKEKIGGIIDIQENLSKISSHLGSSLERVNDLSKQTRIISLYGKIEAARIPTKIEGFSAIVNEMQILSQNYSKIAEELWNFFKPVNREIGALSRMIKRLEGMITRLGDLVSQSANAFQENKELIEKLTEISSIIRPSMDKQKEIVEGIGCSFKKVTISLKNNAGLIKELEEGLDGEKTLLDNFIKEEKWRDVKSFDILEKKERPLLRIHIEGEPLFLDPSKVGDVISGRVASCIHRGLFNFGYSGEIYSLIVKEWKISEDALRWDFTIKEDVITHKGNKIDAEDVKYSLERLKDGVNKFIIDPVQKIEIESKYSLSFHLKEPFMPLPSNLATIGGSIISRDEDQGRNPSGIGPFRFVEWKKEDHIILEGQPDYVLGRPYLSKLIYKIGESGLEAFKANQVDIASISSDEVSKIRKDGDLRDKLISTEYLNVNYMGFNFKRKDLPFNNRKVRQALNYAVDNRALIEKTSSGLERISRGIFPPGLSVYDPNPKLYKYNLDLAKDLLDQAGYPNGLPGIYKLTISDSPTNIKRAKFLKGSFSIIGVKIEIEKYPRGKFLDKVYNGETELFLLGWSADNVDPNNFLFPLFHSSSMGIGGNAIFYSNENIDRAIEEGLREINPVKRKKIYRELEPLIVERAPWVFLTHDVNFVLVSPKIFGFKTDPLNYPHYEWIGVE